MGIDIESRGPGIVIANITGNTIHTMAPSGDTTASGINVRAETTCDLTINVSSNNVTVEGDGVSAYGIEDTIGGGSVTGLIQNNTGTVSGSATTKEAIYAPTVTQENNTIVVE